MSANISAVRVGIVDFGTVAIRLDIYEILPAEEPKLLAKYRSLPRLGQVLDDPVPFRDRVLQELGNVRKLAEEHRADDLIVVGTMALRKAKGVEEVLLEVHRTLGMNIRVISGEEEAVLTARGILSQEKHLPGSIALVDIGGGSTEVSFCLAGQRVQSHSVEVGVLKAGSRERSQLENLFSKLRPASEQFGPTLVVGSSGTIRSIERILSPNSPKWGSGKTYDLDELKQLLKEFTSLSPEELLQKPGVEASRADILVPGMLIFDTLLDALNIKQFRISHFSLRHGLLDEWMEKSGRHLARPRQM